MGTYFCIAFLTVALALTCASVEFKVIADSNQGNDDAYLQLLRRVENLEIRDKQQQNEIDTLRKELKTEKARTSEMEGKLSRLQMRFVDRSHSNKAVTLPADLNITPGDEAKAVPQKRHDYGEGESDGNARSVKSQGNHPSRIRRHTDMPVVAFHATLTKDSVHTGVHQSIAFDRVVTNVGSAYNPHVGSFVAPVAGIYVFHTTIMVDHSFDTHASIVKNGQSIANLYIRGSESIFGSDSAMAVVYLDKGDDVMVHNVDPDRSLNGDNYTMFSGFLLYKETADMSIVG